MAHLKTVVPVRRPLLGALVLLAALGLAGCDKLGLGGAASGGGKAAYHAVDITGATYAQSLNLSDADGKPRSLAEWKGKVVVVFFGYTQCPDVCPTTLGELAEVKRSLGPQSEQVQGVFVSVDPERDTPAVLKAYVANFGAGFVGLTGTPEQVRNAARDFKVFFNKVPGKTDTSYTIDHTAGSYIYDKQGRVRLFSRYGSGAKALAEDIKALLAEG
jgi:protein SCO1/2